MELPPRPLLAPQNASDNERAAERVRFGIAYLYLECKFKAIVAYLKEQPVDCEVNREPPNNP